MGPVLLFNSTVLQEFIFARYLLKRLMNEEAQDSVNRIVCAR